MFAIDAGYGSFVQSALTMTTAGKTTVTGTWLGKQATAEVIATELGTRVDPTVTAMYPGFDPSWFNAPDDPTRAPTIVYPPAAVIMPRNIGDFDVHWTDASTNKIFEVSLVTSFTNYRVYVLGGNGTAGAGPDPSWMAFLASEWTAAVGADIAIQLQVRGIAGPSPTGVGSSAPQLVSLSNEAMNGGLYYWAAAGTTSPEGIFRHDVANAGQPAQEYMTRNQTNNRCVACHVLSRDGTKMAITWDGGNGAANFLDVGSRVFQTEANKWNFGTFTPDGNQFLGVEGGTLVVRKYVDQSVVSTMPGGGWVTHPDLSPDGTKLVYVRPQVTHVDWSFGSGEIFIRSYDQGTGSFGPEQMLVADASNNYYPSFSPDGAWVLFNKSADNSTAGAYNNASAELWVIKSDGSAPALQLTSANQSTGLTDSWGRWAPFAQTFGAANEPMYWITVSSKRNFGVRLFGAGRPQIWMTPFFGARATAGMDPSSIAFRLPFQNIDSDNHIAQWTTQIVPIQ